MRVAVVDCGTNTIRLLIADPTPDGGLTTVDRRLELVRLGQGVDATGEFHLDALERTFAAVDRFAGVISSLNVDKVRFLATSASRDVRNRQAFYDGVRQRLGVGVDVISGDEEARLTYLGALSGGPIDAGPVLVMDIGGGSTELILGDTVGRSEASVSLNMGSVRIRERLMPDDPPTAGQIAAARAFVGDMIDGSGVDVGKAVTWIGVAGTATSLSALVMGLTTYDPALVHNSVVPLAWVSRMTDTLLRLSVGEILARWPMVQHLRAEVICAGALIADEVGKRTGQPLLVRETDLLDGATLELMRQPS